MFISSQKDTKEERKKEDEYTLEEKARLNRTIDSLVYDIENKEKELAQIEKTLYDLEARRKNLKEDLERLYKEKTRLTQNLDRMEIH